MELHDQNALFLNSNLGVVYWFGEGFIDWVVILFKTFVSHLCEDLAAICKWIIPLYLWRLNLVYELIILREYKAKEYYGNIII